jgi:hypothetical protein
MREFELSGDGICNISTAGAGTNSPRSKRQIKQEAFIKMRKTAKADTILPNQ